MQYTESGLYTSPEHHKYHKYGKYTHAHKCKKSERMACASSGHPIFPLHLARHGRVNILCRTGTHKIQMKEETLPEAQRTQGIEYVT